MSRHFCCPVLVWVLLQLIYFFPALTNNVTSLKQEQSCKQFYGTRHFIRNLNCNLSRISTDSNEWKNCNLVHHYLTFVDFRNVMKMMKCSVERKRFLLFISNEKFPNVSSKEKEMTEYEIASLLERIRQYPVDLNYKIAIFSIKISDVFECNNLLYKQVVVIILKINSIQDHSHNRFLKTVQLPCIIDDHSCSWIFEFIYKCISGRTEIVQFFYPIPSQNLTIEYFDKFVDNSILKDLLIINVRTLCRCGFDVNLATVLTASKSHPNDSHIGNFSKSNLDRKGNSLKESTTEPNENYFTKKSNSRKSRVLLWTNPNSNSDERRKSIDTSQKVRYARFEDVQSTNNQRTPPNKDLCVTKLGCRRKRKSRRRLARDLTSAATAKRTIAMSSREADATRRSARISFSSDNEADYRREIDRQIEADFARIKDTLRLEKSDAVSSETLRWPSSGAKNNRQSVIQPAAIDTREPEIITTGGACATPRCQQVIRHGLEAKSRGSDELPANSRGNVAGGIAAVAPPRRKVVDGKTQRQLGSDDGERKLVGEALIILNKNASPFSVMGRSDETGMNLKYSVESISLGLDELLKMGKEVMKTEPDSAARNETKRAGLSCRNCLKYAKGNNESHRGLEDDEGARLEEELKELRSMHIQRGRRGGGGFANGGKNEMRFAAGDKYILRRDENARLNNAYSAGHAHRVKKRCHKKQRTSPFGSHNSDQISKVTRNGISCHNRVKNNLQYFNDRVPFDRILTNNEVKATSRIEKSDPYKEYEHSSEDEKLFSDTKVTEHSRSRRKTSQETPPQSNQKEVIERKIQSSEDTHSKVYETSNPSVESKMPRKLVGKKFHKIAAGRIPRSDPLLVNRPRNSLRPQAKKKNKLSQFLPNRKLKSTGADGAPHKVLRVSKSVTLSRDIDNIYHYDYGDLKTQSDSVDQTINNRDMKTRGVGRKLLYSNSAEYDDGRPISVDEESNCDYVEKFYGDQRYEKGSAPLHYFQINLRNVTPPAKAEMKGEGLEIELARYHVSKSMKTFSGNHKVISKNCFFKRTLKSVAQEENSDHVVRKNSVKSLYLSGDLIGYDYDPEENENSEKFKRGIAENVDPDLARLFADGQEYEINVRGKLHLRLKDLESDFASEKSSKKKRSSESKIAKSRKKLARTEREFAIADKRTKRDPGQESANAHRRDGNPKSKTSKTGNPLKKISDYFKKKFGGAGNKKGYNKKIRANAKVVRIMPGQDAEDDASQSTFPPSDDQSTTTPESRHDDCKCAHETTTLETFAPTDITQPTESVTENNDSNYEEPDSCQCAEKSTEMSSTQQYVTNRPESDYSSTKAQLSHEIVSSESPGPITATAIISTSEQPEKATVVSSNDASSDSSPEEKAKVKNALEILNFIKKLDELMKDQKVPFRIRDENGGVEIKLEKIYIRRGNNQSIVELKDVSEKNQKNDISDEGDTSEVIHQLDNHNDETSIPSVRNENARSFSRGKNEKILNGDSSQNAQRLSNANVESGINERNKVSQRLRKPEKYDNAIVETYIEASVPKSLRADKNTRNNEPLPAKQWIDEQRIASNDQSSSDGRKRKKWRRKKRRHRLRKRTSDGTGIASKKGEPPHRLRRRRRRRLRRSST